MEWDGMGQDRKGQGGVEWNVVVWVRWDGMGWHTWDGGGGAGHNRDRTGQDISYWILIVRHVFATVAPLQKVKLHSTFF